MSNETKYFILTVNGTQKFLIASNADDFDEQVRKWIVSGTVMYGDELRYKSITGGVFYLTGKTSLIILKNAATISWEGARSIENFWIVA